MPEQPDALLKPDSLFHPRQIVEGTTFIFVPNEFGRFDVTNLPTADWLAGKKAPVLRYEDDDGLKPGVIVLVVDDKSDARDLVLRALGSRKNPSRLRDLAAIFIANGGTALIALEEKSHVEEVGISEVEG